MSDAGEEENVSSKPQKRLRSSPMYLTPHRPEKRVPLRELAANNGFGVAGAPRLLSQAFQHLDESTTQEPSQEPSVVQPTTHDKWGNNEMKALVDFLLFHCIGESWPTHKNMEF